MHIPSIHKQQKDYFNSAKTLEVAFRKKSLIRFRESIKTHEQDIIDSLYADFKKPAFEAFATELSVVYKELNLTIKNIEKWQKPKRVKPSLLNFPSSAKIHYDPYGATLVIAPWNYPFQLAAGPIIGAIAAGNTVVLKPSELTPTTSTLLAKIVSEVFDEGHVTVVQGDKEVSTQLLKHRWDYIFFTGSVAVGKIIYKAAAEHLTPVTLELGGKSPTIVDQTAKIPLTAKRIVWGKFVNAGQTCIAPDYILVHRSKEEELLAALDLEITKAYGADPKVSPDFARIINEKNFDRLSKILENATIYRGGDSDKTLLYMAPTVLNDVKISDQSMQEEIFGPILPVLTYETKEDIKHIISSMEKPLSAYLFSKDTSFQNWFLKEFSFGGGVLNDALVHFINDKLPFGGVGHSGIGKYHGKHSFFAFSHCKSIVNRYIWTDLPFRYAPYHGKVDLIKKISKWL